MSSPFGGPFAEMAPLVVFGIDCRGECVGAANSGLLLLLPGPSLTFILSASGLKGCSLLLSLQCGLCLQGLELSGLGDQ